MAKAREDKIFKRGATRSRALRTLAAVACCSAGFAATADAGWQRFVSTGQALDVAVDGAGDVVAAGTSGAGLLFGKAVVVKYAATSGQELWRTEMEGTDGVAFLLDRMSAVAIDGAGDVVAAGLLRNLGTEADLTVVKLDGNTGMELWRTDIDGTSTSSLIDAAKDVVVDGAGDVIVAGTVVEAGAIFTMIKLSGVDGSEIWRTPVPGNDGVSGASIVIDQAGDIVASGSTGEFAGEVAVIKLDDTDGSLIWRTDLDYNGLAALALDSSGDVIAAGSVFHPSYDHFYITVVKLAGSDGAEVWRTSGLAGAIDEGHASSVAVDANDDVIAGGAYYTGFVNPRFAAMKFDGDDGAVLWRHTVSAPAVNQGFASSVAADAAGDAYAAGRFREVEPSFAVIKLAGASGTEMWRRAVDGPTRSVDYANRLALDGTGSVIAVGTTGPTDSTDDNLFAVLKVSTDDAVVGPLRGKNLVVRDRAGSPTSRRINGTVRDPLVAGAVPGGPNDPSMFGATVRLVGPFDDAVIMVPGGGLWHGLGTPAGSKGWSYRDPQGINGPCKKVIARLGRSLRVVCDGRLGTIPFTLDEATQASLRVSVQLGSGEPQCATFGGTVLEDEGTANPGPSGAFRARDAAAPEFCPP